MDNEKEGPVFKVPKLFGPRPGTKKPVISEDTISNDSNVTSTTNVAENSKVSVEQKIDQPKKSTQGNFSSSYSIRRTIMGWEAWR